MALANYDELKTAIVQQSHREDVLVLVDQFIRLAEADFVANPVETLKLASLVKKATLSVSTQEVALPSGFLSLIGAKIISGSQIYRLEYKAPEQLDRLGGTGVPSQFTITNQIEFNIAPDGTYTLEMIYYSTPTPLDSTNTTNEVLTKYPSIYLYGALFHLFKWADDEENAAKYERLFYQAIQGANRAEKEGRYGAVPAMTPDNFVV